MTPAELKEWREGHKLSLAQLAEILGVNKMTVWNWEIGRREPPKFLHLALAELHRQLASPENPAQIAD